MSSNAIFLATPLITKLAISIIFSKIYLILLIIVFKIHPSNCWCSCRCYHHSFLRSRFWNANFSFFSLFFQFLEKHTKSAPPLTDSLFRFEICLSGQYFYFHFFAVKFDFFSFVLKGMGQIVGHLSYQILQLSFTISLAHSDSTNFHIQE